MDSLRNLTVLVGRTQAGNQPEIAQALLES